MGLLERKAGTLRCTLDQTSELTAINTDIRQLRTLLKQAEDVIKKAVSDGDITSEDAGTLTKLVSQSILELKPTELVTAVKHLS